MQIPSDFDKRQQFRERKFKKSTHKPKWNAYGRLTLRYFVKFG